jgi:Tfp pilus assembly protein PilO
MQTILNRELDENKRAKELLEDKIASVKELDIDDVNSNLYSNKIEIMSLKNNIESISDFKSKLSSSFAKANIDSKEWKEIVQYLKDYSKINKITLYKIKNYTLNSTNIKEQTINMQLIGNGRYKDILNFIKDIESISTMVKIKDIKIAREDKLKFYISLEGWKYKIKGS